MIQTTMKMRFPLEGLACVLANLWLSGKKQFQRPQAKGSVDSCFPEPGVHILGRGSQERGAFPTEGGGKALAQGKETGEEKG